MKNCSSKDDTNQTVQQWQRSFLFDYFCTNWFLSVKILMLCRENMVRIVRQCLSKIFLIDFRFIALKHKNMFTKIIDDRK